MTKENSENSRLNFQFHPAPGKEEAARELISTLEGVELLCGFGPTEIVKIKIGDKPAICGTCPDDIKPLLVEGLSEDRIAAFSLPTTFSSWRSLDKVDLEELREREV